MHTKIETMLQFQDHIQFGHFGVDDCIQPFVSEIVGFLEGLVYWFCPCSNFAMRNSHC